MAETAMEDPGVATRGCDYPGCRENVRAGQTYIGGPLRGFTFCEEHDERVNEFEDAALEVFADGLRMRKGQRVTPQVLEVQRHRNGIAGVPFFAALVDDPLPHLFARRALYVEFQDTDPREPHAALITLDDAGEPNLVDCQRGDQAYETLHTLVMAKYGEDEG